LRIRLVIPVLIALTACILVANVAVLVGGQATSASGGGPTDCALVLGAGVGPDGTPSWVLQDRLTEAIELYRSGRVKTILVSGDHRTLEYDEPNAMRRWLEIRGVPPSDIFMDHAGTDTYSSVWRARHVFGASRVIVITQRFHLPRALWMARSLGIEADGAMADRRRYRGAVWFEVREVLSRTKAVIDVALHRRPHHTGPAISLDQDGRVTAG
jgi:vancomycin permeability regulator SanA